VRKLSEFAIKRQTLIP